jgi:hypothetical protein
MLLKWSYDAKEEEEKAHPRFLPTLFWGKAMLELELEQY